MWFNQTSTATYFVSAVAISETLLNLGSLYSLKRRELHTTEVDLTYKYLKWNMFEEYNLQRTTVPWPKMTILD